MKRELILMFVIIAIHTASAVEEPTFSEQLLEYKPTLLTDEPCAVWITNCSWLRCDKPAGPHEKACDPPYVAKSCQNSLLRYDCSEGEWGPHF